MTWSHKLLRNNKHNMKTTYINSSFFAALDPVLRTRMHMRNFLFVWSSNVKSIDDEHSKVY